MWRMALATAVLLALPGTGFPQSEDVSFVVMGKTTNHRQESGGDVHLLNYHFFAEIFVRAEGRVTEASLELPNGEVKRFEDRGYVLEVHGERSDREETIDRLYPNGDYRLRYRASSGGLHDRRLTVRDTGEGTSRIPAPPRITLSQDGAPVSPEAVDPSRDLRVTWSAFDVGRLDENGILDDLIFVVLGNCRGEKIVHSGRPFEGTPYLSYDAEGFTFPKGKLAPGEPHQMSVEHATVDTSREEGVVGLVTYAATTFLDFQTTGRSKGQPCPAVMPKIDQGQTDRDPTPAHKSGDDR